MKLYCDCFANREVCGEYCKCCDCHNKINFDQERDFQIQNLIDKNKFAFKSKIV